MAKVFIICVHFNKYNAQSRELIKVTAFMGGKLSEMQVYKEYIKPLDYYHKCGIL